ncbi:NAD-binding protein [Stackebrandtia endophytica]|nr:NAD-binding protein [Stackebrandtia endophytica]
MPPVSLRRNAFRDHVIVCGDDGMAFRLVEELVYRHRENVTVVLPSRRQNHGPQISRVPMVRVVENDQLDEDAFSAARIGTAKALALMVQDDVGNIHAAMRAQEITDIRIVVRVYNSGLGNRIEGLLGDCILLSDASMASPSFVAAALGEVEPRYLPVADRTLYVTTAAQAGRIPGPSWTITAADAPGLLLPGPDHPPDLVITAAFRKPRMFAAASRHRVRRLVTRAWDEIREILDRKLRFITLALLFIILVGTFLIWEFHNARGDMDDVSLLTAGYIALLAAAGGIDPDLTAPAAEKFAHTLVSFAGVLLVPVFTASIVENMVGRRMALEAGRLRGPISDHVIVVGLGNVGIQVATQLHAMGVPVVAVERDERSRGVDAARNQGISVVLGDASHSETLENAQVRTCRSLVAVTSNDIVNLEAALHARRTRGDLRTVLRLFDPDLAARVHRTFGIGTTLSVAAVAAAEFAAAMTERNVKGTIPIGRHLLLIGELAIEPGSALEGAPVSEIDTDEHIRVLAISGPGETTWTPDPARPLEAGDTVLVLATRRGLSSAVERSVAPDTQEGL